jgi:hypothetical protein
LHYFFLRVYKEVDFMLSRHRDEAAAEATLAGIELYRMLKKGQHVLTKNLNAFEQFYALVA